MGCCHKLQQKHFLCYVTIVGWSQLQSSYVPFWVSQHRLQQNTAIILYSIIMPALFLLFLCCNIFIVKSQQSGKENNRDPPEENIRSASCSFTRTLYRHQMCACSWLSRPIVVLEVDRFNNLIIATGSHDLVSLIDANKPVSFS